MKCRDSVSLLEAEARRSEDGNWNGSGNRNEDLFGACDSDGLG